MAAIGECKNPSPLHFFRSHFPVNEEITDVPHIGPTAYFSVDCGDSTVQKFTSLDALVLFYSVYVQLQENSEGLVEPEIFPCPTQ